MEWFIDKFDMHQDYPEGGLPIVGKHGIIRHDIATGELVSDTVNSLQHSGSFSSLLNIRSTGSSVTVNGNPSRYNRSENLWGFTTHDECAEVYNQVLDEYGLPPFTPCKKIEYGQTPDGKKVRKIADGAIIRHVDYTRNYEVGRGREYSFLRAVSSLTIGRGLQPFLYSNGATVAWGTHRKQIKGEGSKFRYDKFYHKEKDLVDHRSERLKGASSEEIAYYDRVIEYCRDVGIVREEQGKKGPLLRKYGNLAFYGLCNEADFEPYLNDIETAIKRLEVSHMTYEMISEQLITRGICKSAQSANATEAYALKWIHGGFIDKSKSQYHVHRARLLDLGFDIAVPHDITRLPPQIRSNEIIDCKLATVPGWYRMPNLTQLKAA